MIKSATQARDIIEWKFNMVASSAQNISLGGLLIPLADINQGDSDSTRNGDAVSLKKLEINFGFYAATQANACRLLVFQWFPLTTDGPGLASLLFNTGTAYTVFSNYQQDTYQSYQILYDEIFSVSPTEALRVGRCVMDTFARRSIQYTAGTITGTSKLYAYVISDDGVTPYPTFSCHSKLTYTDA